MTTRTMEARAVISAVDRTGGVLAAVAGKLRALSRAGAAVQGTVGRASMASSALAAVQSRAHAATIAGVGAAGRFVAPAAIAYGAGRAVKSFAETERRLTRIGITADATREEMRGFNAEAQELASSVALPFDKIAAGAEALAAQGRGLREIRGFLPAVARTAQASGAEVEDIAKSADAVGTHLKIGAGEMQKAFDIMAEGGKAGQFELKDMARYLPSLAPAAKALGLEGTKGLADLVAMLQILRKGSGTAEEAAASMNNILQKMRSEETTKRFKKLGVDLEDALKKGQAEGRNLIEVFEEATWKAIKGDLAQLPKVINDMEFARGMRALLSLRGEWQKMAGSIGKASGTVDADLARVLGDSQAKIDRLANSWSQMVKSVGEGAVNLGAARALEEVAGAVRHLNDELDRFNRGERTHFEKVANALKNYALTGQAVDQPVAELKAARAQKDERDRLEWLRLEAAQRERELARLDEADGATGFMAGLGRGDRKAARARLRAELGGLNETLALAEARDAVNMALTETVAAQRRFAGLSINRAGGVQAIRPGSFGFGPGGAAAAPTSPWDFAPMPGRAPLPPERPGGTPRAIDRIEDVLGPGKVEARLTGSAEVKGETVVKVEVTASSELLRVVDGVKASAAALRGMLNANGPGSTGRSAPDAAAPATGSGGE